MSRKSWSLLFLALGITLISIGFFATNDINWRNNLLFGGIVCGVTGMILKLVAMLGSKE